jgi:formate/nitrite transporter FocA (FNT family)
MTSGPPGPEGTQPVTSAFHRSVDEGVLRLERPLPSLLATGAVGGFDVGLGVFAMLVVEQATGSHMLGALAFGIGFLSLLLAQSELFTENFLVPITAVVAKKAPWWSVLRLWAGTAVMNLVGGFVAMGLVMMAFPNLHHTARVVAEHPATIGFGRVALASAIVGGALITVMTWMERATESITAKIISAWAIAFLLAAAPAQHAIVISLEMFAALAAGASFGYLHWFATFAFAALANAIGGVGLVTMLRLVQVGGEAVHREQDRPKDVPREESAAEATEG